MLGVSQRRWRPMARCPRRWRARWPRARWPGRGDDLASITGIAGPGGSEFKPEGRVCFAVRRGACRSSGETVEFGAIGRAKVRQASTDHALALLLRAMA
jgi:hypothetical protein